MPNGQVLAANPADPSKLWGIASKQILVLDAVTANDVGMWQPMLPFHKGSLEAVYAAGVSAATVQLMASNAQNMPANGFTVTVGGTVTPGDVLQITIESPALVAPGIVGRYTVQGGDTHNSIATALAAALEAAIKSSRAHVIFGEDANITAGAMQATATSAAVNVFWNYPLPDNSQPIALVTAESGGATETLTVGQYDDGQGFAVTGASLTASGRKDFDAIGTWMKTKLTGYTGSGAVSAIVQLVTP